MTFGILFSNALALWLSCCCWRIESFLAPSPLRSITQSYPSSDVCQSKWSFLERRSKRPVKRREHRISLSATPSDEDDDLDLPEKRVPTFPYGVSSFKDVSAKGRFYVDKTSYIKELEKSGDHIKIWRPRRIGKTHVCNILTEYYDKANSKDQLKALFGETDVMKQKLTTKEMGSYLVLRFDFSDVSVKLDARASFRNTINDSIYDFSEKYYNAGFLKKTVKIDIEDYAASIRNLVTVSKDNNQQIYLIVDEVDSFVNRLIMSVDTSKPDSGLQQYEDLVKDKEDMLREWGACIKKGTNEGVIARSFFTGISPQAFSDGLSSLNMVADLTFATAVEGLFGIKEADVRRGLNMIEGLEADELERHLDFVRAQYNGYRFVETQKEALYNSQYVLYYLHSLDVTGKAPKRIMDEAVSSTSDVVAEFLASNHKPNAPYSFKNFILGILNQPELIAFEQDVSPTFSSSALFKPDTVSDSVISLAYYHGFLTYKLTDPGQTPFLTTPNLVQLEVYIRPMYPILSKTKDLGLNELVNFLRNSTPKETQRAIASAVGLITTESSKESIKQVAQAIFKRLKEDKLLENFTGGVPEILKCFSLDKV